MALNINVAGKKCQNTRKTDKNSEKKIGKNSKHHVKICFRHLPKQKKKCQEPYGTYCISGNARSVEIMAK